MYSLLLMVEDVCIDEVLFPCKNKISIEQVWSHGDNRTWIFWLIFKIIFHGYHWVKKCKVFWFCFLNSSHKTFGPLPSLSGKLLTVWFVNRLEKMENLILFFFTFTYNEHIIHGHPFPGSYDSVSIRPQCLHTVKWFQRSNHWQEWGVGGCKVLEQDHWAQQDHCKYNSCWLETRLTFWSLYKSMWGWTVNTC